MSKKKKRQNNTVNIGSIYRGNTKYIDVETKPQRDYAVVDEYNGKVTVAKVKSIKTVNNNGKNTDKALVEINAPRYGYTKRTGIDFQRFKLNRMSGKPLKLSDKNVFPEGKPRAKLSNRDRDKALYHTGVKKRQKNKK